MPPRGRAAKKKGHCADSYVAMMNRYQQAAQTGHLEQDDAIAILSGDLNHTSAAMGDDSVEADGIQTASFSEILCRIKSKALQELNAWLFASVKSDAGGEQDDASCGASDELQKVLQIALETAHVDAVKLLFGPLLRQPECDSNVFLSEKIADGGEGSNQQLHNHHAHAQAIQNMINEQPLFFFSALFYDRGPAHFETPFLREDREGVLVIIDILSRAGVRVSGAKPSPLLAGDEETHKTVTLPTSTPLMIAIDSMCNKDVVRRLLEKIRAEAEQDACNDSPSSPTAVDVLYALAVNQANHKGETALSTAIGIYDEDWMAPLRCVKAAVVNALLTAGASPESCRFLVAVKGEEDGGEHSKSFSTFRKRTELHRAARYGCEASIRVLAQIKGIDPNAVDEEGDTPLMMAVHKGHVGAVKALLAPPLSADVNLPNNDETTPLGQATYEHSLGSLEDRRSIVEALLAAGADVNGARGKVGAPLCHAAASGDTVMLKALLRAAASSPSDDDASDGGVLRFDVVDSFLGSPLHASASRGRFEALQLLLSLGISVNLVNVDGRTALSEVARFHNPQKVQGLTSDCSVVRVVRLLADAGADTDVVGHGNLLVADQFMKWL